MKEGPVSEGGYLTSGEGNQPLWSGQKTFSLRKKCVEGDVVKSLCSGV